MAADLTQSFMGKHVEKIVLAAAVAVVALSAVLFVGMRGPQDAERRALQAEITGIKQGMQETNLDKILDAAAKKQLGLDQPVGTVADLENRLAALAAPWTPKLHMGGSQHGVTVEPVAAEPPQKPERILPVTDLETAVGRGVTTDPKAPNPLARLASKNISDIAWTSCVGRFDLTDQVAEFAKAKALPDTEVIVTRVDLERRVLKPDGQWSDWEALAPAVPDAVAAKLPKRPANPQEKAAVYNWWLGVTGAQEAVRRPPFFSLVALDEGAQVASDLGGGTQEVPRLRVPQPAPKAPPVAESTAAVAEGAAPPPPPPPGPARPPWAPEVVTPGVPTEPGTRREAPHVFATVWAHDLSVKPGGAYQYRMRVAVFNPAYGQPGSDEKIRWVLDFDGEWSESSATVRIKPLIEFYFVGSFGEKANLQLHRWIHGQWVVIPSVPSSVGSPVVYVKRDGRLRIPGAGGKQDEVTTAVDLSPDVLLVDMIRNFPYYPVGNRTPTRVNVLVYTDAQGRMQRRIDWEDRREAIEKRAAHEGAAPAPPPKSQATEPPKTPPKTPPKPPPKTPPTVRPKG